MRCLMCGHDMVLIAALPAEDGLVLGFEQQTLQCRACGETLHRFVFVSGVTAADAETGTNENQKPALATNGIENAMRALNGTDQAAFIANGARKPLVQHWRIAAVSSAKEKPSVGDPALTNIERAGIRRNGAAFDARESTSVNANDKPPERWSQAVEKFRRYEAALNRRADSRTKSNANGTHPFTASRIQRPKSPPQRIPVDFDVLWNGMPAPAQQKRVEQSVASASLVPLPRALSLVVIEPQEASTHTRGDKHGSKKMLEKLYHWLTRESAMPRRADLI